MELLESLHQDSPVLQGPLRAHRIRPGERPVWVDLPVVSGRWPRWRRHAAACNMTVDAWVSVCLEFHGVLEPLATVGVGAADLDAVAAHALATPRLAPTTALRDWVRALQGRRQADIPKDELPTLVVPERVLARWMPRLDVPELEEENGQRAIRCDLAAAVSGRTLERWALEAALSLAG